MFPLLCLLLITGSTTDVSDMNDTFDLALEQLNTIIKVKGNTDIYIPYINHDWVHHQGLLKISGYYRCWNGYIKTLSPLKRTGNVTMRTKENHFTMTMFLGLSKLETGFKRCQFKVNHLFSVSRRFRVTLTNNTFSAQTTLVKNSSSCNAQLDHVRLTNLGKVNVTMGNSILHWIENKIVARFASRALAHVIDTELQKQVHIQIPYRSQFCGKMC